MTTRDNSDDPALIRGGNVPEDDDRDESTGEHKPEVADEIKPSGPAPLP